MLLFAAVSLALALPPNPENGPPFGQGCDLRDTHHTFWYRLPRVYQGSIGCVTCVVRRETSGGYVEHQVGPFFPHGDAWLEDELVSHTSVYVDGVRLMRPGMLY